jgi:release factor glutamine methyltransferase
MEVLSKKNEVLPSKTEARSARTLGEALVWAEKRLKSAGLPDPGVHDPRHEALFMVADLMGLQPTEVYLKRGSVIDSDRFRTLRQWVERRLGREPSQYITGATEFRGLSFKVNPYVLIPRPETELLVCEGTGAIDSRSPLILDLCTGSGCIAVAMAKEVPGARIFALDISGPALRVAGENAAVHDVAYRIEFLEGDLFAPLKGRCLEASFDLILSNPPYVSGDELKRLKPEVRHFEPTMALYGGEDGLHFIRRIVNGAPDYLKPGGALILEIGYGQSEDVRIILEGSGKFDPPLTRKDYSGIDRFIKAQKKSPPVPL